MVSAGAAHLRVRAGMTVAEGRSRCSDLRLLDWNDLVLADALARASAGFLAASPQVTPVSGAPGTWWIGASGFDGLGGEHTLARALRAIAVRWHPAARVAIASSCVAARAATWDARRADGPAEWVDTQSALVPVDGCAEYLARAPLTLLPMDAELRDALQALGLGTAGAFAALAPGDVEQRWGETGLAAWRLARGEDRRRPGLARAEHARTASADLALSTTITEPLVFLVRGALDRLVQQCVRDGRSVAAVAITLVLDDARGALPSAGGHAHTITREVRPARPLARVAPLLELCQGLLGQWTLPAPVCGIAVTITATAPLAGDQGDLLDASWRDAGAAEAALARLRAELGVGSVVTPILRDAYAPERAGGWEENGLRVAHIAEAPAALPTADTMPRALRMLATPEAVEVELANDRPVALHWRARRRPIVQANGPERLAGTWWQDEYARDYWRCAIATEGDVMVFADRASETPRWFVQGWYD